MIGQPLTPDPLESAVYEALRDLERKALLSLSSSLTWYDVQDIAEAVRDAASDEAEDEIRAAGEEGYDKGYAEGYEKGHAAAREGGKP